MKILKFHTDLVPLILNGSKTSTWRLFDDKNLTVGDQIELREFTKDDPFGLAVIANVTEKKFSQLTEEDKTGHESYVSDDEMYETYSKYYSTKVEPATELKIIHFELAHSS